MDYSDDYSRYQAEKKRNRLLKIIGVISLIVLVILTAIFSPNDYAKYDKNPNKSIYTVHLVKHYGLFEHLHYSGYAIGEDKKRHPLVNCHDTGGILWEDNYSCNTADNQLLLTSYKGRRGNISSVDIRIKVNGKMKKLNNITEYDDGGTNYYYVPTK